MSLVSIEDLANPKLFFKMLKYEREAKKYDKMAKKFAKRAEESKKEKVETVEENVDDAATEETPTVEHVEGEVLEDNNTKKFPLTNIIYDASTDRFILSDSVDDTSMFDNDVETVEAPFVADVPDLESDDIENIISYVIRDVKRLNPDMTDSLIRHTVLAILFLTDKINRFDMQDHYDHNDPDRYSEINTIGKFLTADNYKIFLTENCYEVSEYLSMKELKDIIDSLDTKLNWTGNKDYIEIVKMVREGYTLNKNKENVFNGLDPIDEAPILFNNAILGSINNYDVGSNPLPRLNKSISDTLKKAFENILKDNKEFTVEIYPAVDNNNPNYALRDIAQAVVKVTDTRNGYYSTFNIDLNTIVGNGYNLIVPTNFNGIMQDIYVNIKKHPDLVRKILTTNYQFRFNGPNMVDIELKTVMADYIAQPVIYKQYDFSNMYKHLVNLSEEDMVIFTNNLMGIINLNWGSLGVSFQMPRFRFRSFTNARKFILVSDRNVRVQSSEWMSQPFSLYAKQFINSEGYSTDDSEMVIDLDNNDIKIYMNKVEVNL